MTAAAVLGTLRFAQPTHFRYVGEEDGVQAVGIHADASRIGGKRLKVFLEAFAKGFGEEIERRVHGL